VLSSGAGVRLALTASREPVRFGHLDPVDSRRSGMIVDTGMEAGMQEQMDLLEELTRSMH
jgi:hypothetical protein